MLSAVPIWTYRSSKFVREETGARSPVNVLLFKYLVAKTTSKSSKSTKGRDIKTATEPTTIDTSPESKQMDNYCFARQQRSQTSSETAALACMSSALTKEDEPRQSQSPPWGLDV